MNKKIEFTDEFKKNYPTLFEMLKNPEYMSKIEKGVKKETP